MKKQAITVTKADIDEGCPNSSHFCAMALAFERAVGGKVSVGCYAIYTIHGQISHTPESKEFIDDFDNGVKVSPQTFIFEVPE